MPIRRAPGSAWPLALVFWCALFTREAAAAPFLRVLFLCTPDVACESFAKRLRGQTSDLRIDLETRPFPAPAATRGDEEVAAADRMAASHAAEVAIWWRGGTLVTLMRTPPEGRVLVREIARIGPLGTAQLESGSLVARTAIVATLNGTPMGVPRSPPPPPKTPEFVAAPSQPPHEAPAPRWQLASRLGWSGGWDGLPADPNHGLELRVEGRIGKLGLGVLWIERWATTVTVPEARGALDGRQVGLLLAYDLFNERIWSLGAEARFGWLTSWVEPLSGPLQDELRFVRRFAGLGFRVRRAILPGRLGAYATVAVERVERPFNVGLRDPSGYRPLWYMSATQPSLGAGFELTFSR